MNLTFKLPSVFTCIYPKFIGPFANSPSDQITVGFNVSSGVEGGSGIALKGVDPAS